MRSLLPRFTTSIALVLFLFTGCGTTHPHRVQSAVGLPQMPFLGADFKSDSDHPPETKPDPAIAPSDRPEKKFVGLGAGYFDGLGYGDSGQAGGSSGIYGNIDFPIQDRISVGGVLFGATANDDVAAEDRFAFGLGSFAQFLLLETQATRLEIAPAILYASNNNKSNNCDNDLLKSQPRDANGNCIVSWRSETSVYLLETRVSAPFSYKFTRTFRTIFSPGLRLDHLRSNNHVDGSSDIKINKAMLSPTGMLHFRFGSERMHFQLGAGASQAQSFGAGRSRTILITDASLMLRL